MLISSKTHYEWTVGFIDWRDLTSFILWHAHELDDSKKKKKSKKKLKKIKFFIKNFVLLFFFPDVIEFLITFMLCFCIAIGVMSDCLVT